MTMETFVTGAGLIVFVGMAMGTGSAEQKSTPAPGNPVVIIDTSMGSITAELFRDKAPKSVENFLAYAKSGFYDGTVFHRVIRGFMIQGGGMKANLDRKPTKEPIENEATNGLKNARGTLAMARTGVVNSATSQFFINTADNKALDHRSKTDEGFGYAVFGRVIDGMDVVDKIEAVKTTTSGNYRDVPAEAVTIKGVKVKSE
jgi:peptidyl-prolyl cis-trans isomerase B (cyclophilin B)